MYFSDNFQPISVVLGGIAEVKNILTGPLSVPSNTRKEGPQPPRQDLLSHQHLELVCQYRVIRGPDHVHVLKILNMSPACVPQIVFQDLHNLVRGHSGGKRILRSIASKL